MATLYWFKLLWKGVISLLFMLLWLIHRFLSLPNQPLSSSHFKILCAFTHCFPIKFVALSGDESSPPLEKEITTAAAAIVTWSSWIWFPPNVTTAF